MAGGWREREEGERAEGGQSSEICSGMKQLHSTEKALNSMLYVKTHFPQKYKHEVTRHKSDTMHLWLLMHILEVHYPVLSPYWKSLSAARFPYLLSLCASKRSCELKTQYHGNSVHTK